MSQRLLRGSPSQKSQIQVSFSFVLSRLFASMNVCTSLKAVKNNGVSAKERGETGPMVINEYYRDPKSNALCGSRND